jgi:TetR/AcrR family transcriptional repressor of bet genes
VNVTGGELARAFARVLGAHGPGGATIAAVAAEAGVAPVLVHHHFENKQALYEALLEVLTGEFRRRPAAGSESDPLDAYVNAALALGERSDVAAVRAWVGIFAEALGEPSLFARVKRRLDVEVAEVQRRSGGALSPSDASAVVAFVVGALVLGPFAPRKTSGIAAPALRRMIDGLKASVTGA